MEKKTFQGTIKFKANSDQTGEFSAVFATLNVIDLDKDVTLPGAFTDGQKVRIASWGHKWHELPVGRGVIHADAEIAWVDGCFFLETEGGMETYKTVKAMGDLQEWSYGFDVLKRRPGKLKGQNVQFLESMKVHEVSPVLLGAGIGTHTTTIKAAGNSRGPSPQVMRAKIVIKLMEENQ